MPPSSQNETTSVHHFSQSVPLASPMDNLHLFKSTTLFQSSTNSSHHPHFYLHPILASFFAHTFAISLAFSHRCNVPSPHLITPHHHLQLNKIAESRVSGFTREIEFSKPKSWSHCKHDYRGALG